MFTSFDKALVAFLSSLAFMATYLLGDIGFLGLLLDADYVRAIVAVLSPILVYQVPNKGFVLIEDSDNGSGA